MKRGMNKVALFWTYVKEGSEGCLLWVGGKDKDGYGKFRANTSTKGTVRAHRFIYEKTFGVISWGLTLDHLCRTKACVNPYHLEPVTNAENIRRGENGNRKKTHCPQGHLYTDKSFYEYSPGKRGRRCLSCHATRERKRRAQVS